MKSKRNETWMWLIAALAAAAVSAASCGDDENPAGPPTTTTTTESGGGGTGGTGGDGSGGNVGGAGGIGGWNGGPLGSYPGQPPVMAHDPFGCGMNCLDCHETGSSGAPVTPHPERLICRQCHVAQENVELWVENDF